MAATKQRPRPRTRDRRRLPADRPRAGRRLDHLLLDGRRLDMQVGDRLTGARLERTMEGASTLTLDIWDGDRAVLRSGVLGERVMSKVARVELDGLGYIALGASKAGDTLTVTCEDEIVTALKRHGRGKPLRVSRNQLTRAGFCARMFRAAGVPVIVLDEDVVQPIAGRADLRRELRKARREAAHSSDTDSDRSRGGRSRVAGVRGQGLTIKRAAATSEQRRNVGAALDVAGDVRAGERATLALLVAGIAEGQWIRNRLNRAGSGAKGPLQVMPRTAAALGVNPSNVAQVSRIFLVGDSAGRSFTGGPGAIKLARENPGWSPGAIANAVEGGGAGAAFYDEWVEEARRWLGAAGDLEGGDESGRPGAAWIKQFAYDRRKNESTWQAAKRLLDEVHWRLFVREGVAIIASDEALMRARSTLQLTERSTSVESIDFEWHRALRAAEASAKAYAGRYQADPGEPAEIDGLPPLERRFLLESTSQALLDDDKLVDLELRRPQRAKPEPSSEVVTRGATGNVAGAGGDRVERLLAEMKAISKATRGYDYGGGHGAKLASLNNSQPLDCSSSTSLALFRAGLFGDRQVAIVSGQFASSWGKPGRGKHFTVWANGGHVFVELHGMGEAKSFDTRRIGDSRSGPRVRSAVGPTGGFTPRHYPGL